MSSVINDLLNDLDRIPTPNNPGTLRVRGRSYEVFTVENEGNTIIAASLYGILLVVFKIHLINDMF